MSIIGGEPKRPPQPYRVVMTFILDGPMTDQSAHLYVDALARGLEYNKPEVKDLEYKMDYLSDSEGKRNELTRLIEDLPEEGHGSVQHQLPPGD